MLSEKNGASRIQLRFKISQGDLAAMAGVARENVSRTMSEWRKRDIVTRSSNYCCINDPKRWRRMRTSTASAHSNELALAGHRSAEQLGLRSSMPSHRLSAQSGLVLLFKLLFPKQFSRAAPITSSEQPAIINRLNLREPNQLFVEPYSQGSIVVAHHALPSLIAKSLSRSC